MDGPAADDLRAQLAQAGEIGQHLLARNASLEAELAASRGELEDLRTRYLKQEEATQATAAQDDMARYGNHADGLSLQIELAQVQEELAELKQQRDFLKEAKEQLALEQKRADAAEMALAGIKEAAERDSTRFSRESAQREKAEEKLRSESILASQKIAECSELQAKAEAKAHRAKAEAAQAHDELARVRRERDEAVAERAVGENTLSSLVRQNHLLLAERDDLQRSLQRQREEGSFREASHANVAADGSVAADDFADELSALGFGQGSEQVIAEKSELVDDGATLVSAPVPAPSSTSSGSFGSALGGMLPGGQQMKMDEHEYFYLTAAAVKIGLLIKFPHKAEELFSVQVDELFRRVESEKPFHEWHTWITREYAQRMFAEDGVLPQMAGNDGYTAAGQVASRGSSSSIAGSVGSVNDVESIVDEFAARATAQRREKTTNGSLEPFTDETARTHLTRIHSLFRVSKADASECCLTRYLCSVEFDREFRPGELTVTSVALYFYAVLPADSRPGESETRGRPKRLRVTVLWKDVKSVKRKLFSRSTLSVSTAHNQSFNFNGFETGQLEDALGLMAGVFEGEKERRARPSPVVGDEPDLITL